MNMKQRIHIFGASGSGTTTIAKAVCDKLGYRHFDTDNYYWLPTEEPFTEPRPVEERLRMMTNDLGACEKWALSGSLAGWGDPLIPLFELVVFVYVPTVTRVKRLAKREYERYGDAALPGGRRYESTKEFIDWAASYDASTGTGRNLPKHKVWLEELPCPVLKIENISLHESVSTVLNAISMK